MCRNYTSYPTYLLIWSEDQPALEKTDTLESDRLALEEDSNMAFQPWIFQPQTTDTDENSTTVNHDESNGGIAAPDTTTSDTDDYYYYG